MGAALSRTVLGVAAPRVGLLSNGEEAGRGSPLVVEAARRARAARGGRAAAFEFVGNVEGGDVTSGVADVIVTDGFTGNVALKLIESVSQTILRAVRDAATSRRAASSAARCCAERSGAFARRSIPSCRAAPTCWGCGVWASCRTGVSRAPASPRRSCARSVARARTSSGRPPCAGERGGAQGGSPVRAGR